jgi:hypothetical protein
MAGLRQFRGWIPEYFAEVLNFVADYPVAFFLK